MIRAKRWGRAVAAIAIVAIAAACGPKKSAKTAQSARSGSVHASTAGDVGVYTETALRADLMAFADRYASRSVQGVREFEVRAGTPDARFVGLLHRIYTLTGNYELVTSPNISVALLDLLALHTLNRMIWEDYWRDQVFHDAADPVVATVVEAERDVWEIGAKVLSPEQQAELRGIIEDWYRKHPEQHTVGFLRLETLGREFRALETAAKPGGFFGVKKALSTLDETQALVERTLWFATRMQMIAGFQVELAFAKIVTTPEMAQLLDDVDSALALLPELPTQVAQKSLTVSQELLREITVEREAAINQILEGFAEERRQTLEMIAGEEGPRAALGDLRSTIEATDELIAGVERLMGHLEPMLASGAEKPAGPPAHPFDITEYRDTAAEVTKTVERLSELTASIDGLLTSPGLQQGLPVVAAQGQALVRSLFRAGLTLVVVLLAGLLVVLVAYRWVATRMSAART